MAGPRWARDQGSGVVLTVQHGAVHERLVAVGRRRPYRSSHDLGGTATEPAWGRGCGSPREMPAGASPRV